MFGRHGDISKLGIEEGQKQRLEFQGHLQDLRKGEKDCRLFLCGALLWVKPWIQYPK